MQEVQCTETPDDGAECGGVVGTPYKVGPYQITPLRRVTGYNPSYPFITGRRPTL